MENNNVNDNTLAKINDTVEHLWNEELLFLKTIGAYKSTLGNESGVQNFIKHYLDDMGLKTTSFDPDPEKLSSYKNFGKPEWSYENRPVVVGEWHNDTQKTGKSLILQGHIDVVSAEPEEMWESSPFQPSIVDDKMYGRGLADMKGGVTAMIFAVKALKQSGVKLGADLQIQTVTEEECTGNGALALLDKGFTADGALIPEPTGLKAMYGQLGVLWLRVKVQGRGAHVESAEKAQSAIEKAIYLIKSMEEYKEHINNQPKHPVYENHPHPLNVNIGTIKGGDWASNVPNECTFEARVGFYPDVDPEKIKSEVEEWLIQASKKDDFLKETLPEITFFGFNAPGHISSIETELYQNLNEAHKVSTGKDLEYQAFTGTTDMRAFEEFGIPSVCYGPGGENPHGINEFIDLNTLKSSTKAIAAFILNWCKEQNKN